MESISVQKASQLESPAREWLQRLFGRPLGEDEQITIFVAQPHGAPSGKARQAAFKQMDSVLDKSADNLTDVPDAEFDAAVDEAMDQIRKRSD